MKKTLFTILALCLAVVMFNACTLSKADITLTLNPSTVTFEMAGGSQEVSLNDNSWIFCPLPIGIEGSHWTPNVANDHNNEIKEYTYDDWLTFTRTGDKTITVTAKQNTGSGARRASIQIIQVGASDNGRQGPYWLNVVQNGHGLK